MPAESSPDLERAREILFPNLDPEEGRRRIQNAIDGQANIHTWKRIRDIATDEPDLFTHLFALLRRAQGDDGAEDD